MAKFEPEFIGTRGKGIKVPRIRLRRPKGKVGLFFVLFAVVLIGIFVFINLFFTYVRPNEYGIKQVNIGVNPGIQEKIYAPGYAFRIPFNVETIHRFPRQVQVLDLTNDRTGKHKSQYADKMAKIQTSDGFFVDVDVSILYRIIDPYKVITTLGKGRGFLDKGVLPRAEPILKKTLGELDTEEFYNSPLRVAKVEVARELLDAELEPMGMEVQQVLVRFFEYSTEIQRNIEEKKLQDQLVFKNQSEARAATEAAEIKRVTEEGEAKVRVTLEQGRAYKVEKDAERDLYVRSKNAEADLLVQLAEAKRTELRNEAMQAVGADKAVALEMAEVLAGLDVIIVPSGGDNGFNPLDL